MQRIRQISALDLITADASCAVAALIALLPWVLLAIGLSAMPMGAELARVSAVGVAITNASAACYIGHRLRTWRGIGARPLALWGEITGIHYSRLRAQVSYAYEWRGRVYRGRRSLAPSRRERTLLHEGAQLALLVDRESPQHSLLTDLYREPGMPGLTCPNCGDLLPVASEIEGLTCACPCGSVYVLRGVGGALRLEPLAAPAHGTQAAGPAVAQLQREIWALKMQLERLSADDASTNWTILGLFLMLGGIAAGTFFCLPMVALDQSIQSIRSDQLNLLLCSFLPSAFLLGTMVFVRLFRGNEGKRRRLVQELAERQAELERLRGLC